MSEHHADSEVSVLWKVRDERIDALGNLRALVIQASGRIGHEEKVELLNACIGLGVVLLVAVRASGLRRVHVGRRHHAGREGGCA